MKRDKKQKLKPEEKKYTASGITKVEPRQWVYYLALTAILLLSFIVYYPVLSNGLLGWDDEGYIKNNPFVHTINIKNIFSENVMGNYHPLTILTFAVEYGIFGLDETGYHTVNLLLHLMNTGLVFYLVYLLSENKIIGLITALLFGIHPLHVESVAWVSEMKDLLYTFFFLGSYLCYLLYIKNRQWKYYLPALLLFAFSLLSKAMAASLPVIFLLTDYFLGNRLLNGKGKIDGKVFLEKIPFFVLAIALGLVAVYAQKSSDAIQDIARFNIGQRVVFASYGFISYLFKLLLPVQLCAYYPYPLMSGDSLPFQYYACFILLLLLFVLVIYSIRFTRKIFYGFTFFAATVFLVLQLLPVGGAMMADRYSYVPSIGIFYLAGVGLYALWNTQFKFLTIPLLGTAVLFFSMKTYSQCGVWKNNMTLWDDVIRQYQTIPVAYYNRGNAFMQEGNNDRAFDDYSKAIDLKPDYAKAYNNRGNIHHSQKRNEAAISDYSKAIEMKSKEIEVSYCNRGTAYNDLAQWEKAIPDFSRAIALDSQYADAFSNRGIAYKNLGEWEKALSDYRSALEINPQYAKAYCNRGIVYHHLERYNDAIADYSKAIEIDPVYTKAFSNRGVAFEKLSQWDKAIADFSKAIEIDPKFSAAYSNRGDAFVSLGKWEEAISDYSRTIELEPKNELALANREMAYQRLLSGKRGIANP